MVLIERPLSAQIDTKDPSVLYSTDLRVTLVNMFTQLYVGKCFKRCYITEVISVDRHSPPVIEAMRNGGSARIAVDFKVRGIVYDQYEVIPDAKVVEITEDGKMILRSKHAAAILAADSRLQQYRVGMMVPVRVRAARYIPDRDTISVTGIPMVPLDTPAEVFDVIFTDDDMAACSSLFQKLDEAHKRFAAAPHSKDWAALLDPTTNKSTEGAKRVDLRKLRGRGRVSRADWTPLTDVSAWWQEVKEEKGEKGEKLKNSVTVLRGYIAAALKQLEAAASIAEQYDWTVEKSSPWVKLYQAEK